MSETPEPDQPRSDGEVDPAAFGEWFAHATPEQRQDVANTHGDITAHRRDHRPSHRKE